MAKREDIKHELGSLMLLVLLLVILSLTACSKQHNPSLDLTRSLGDKISNVPHNRMLPLDPANAALYGLGGEESKESPETVKVATQPDTKETANMQAPSAAPEVQKTIKEAIGKGEDLQWHRDDSLPYGSKLQTVSNQSSYLRLALLDSKNFHPYDERNEYDQVVNKLLFRSLFRFDSDHKLTKDLVKEYRFSNDHTIVEITLDNEALYADGTPIDAYDVVAALRLLSGIDRSPQADLIVKSGKYYKQFEAIQKIEQVDAYGLKIYLQKPDLYLAYALTFPVIKDDELLHRGLNSFTSSGAYRLVRNKQEQAAYQLPPDSDMIAYVQRDLGDRPAYFNSLLRAFTISDYADEESIIAAFLAKNIDLCYTWPAYNKQLANYEHYVFNSAVGVNLTFNKPGKDELDYYSDIQLLKSQLSSIYSDNFLFREVDPALDAAPWPFVDDLLRPYKSIPAYPLNSLIRERDKLAAAYKQTEWTMIVPAELNFVSDMVARLRQKFTEFGLKLVVYKVPFDNLAAYLEKNAWDLVLSPYIAHRLPDIGYELKELPNGDFWREINGQAYLPKFFVYPNDLVTTIATLKSFVPEKQMLSPLEDVSYQEAFCRAYTATNTFSLLKYNRALYLQDNIRGELRPSALDPLAGVEDLWIWHTS